MAKKRTKKKHRQKSPAVLSRDLHARDRWFTVAKVLLVLSPFLSLAMLRQTSLGVGQNMQQILSDHPDFTVSFMASMTGPFIAYLLGFVQKHMLEGDGSYAVLNLTLMAASELLLSNLFYAVMLAVLLYFVCGMTELTPMRALREKKGKHLVSDLSGGWVLLIFCALCCFLAYRVRSA